MAGLDDLFAQIPTAQIASKLGVDETEVNTAIKTLVPALVGGLQQNAQDHDTAGKIENAANQHAASGLLEGGLSVDAIDEADGDKAVAKIFGGNDSTQVASALSGTGALGGDLVKQLLPILAPIVLAYIGQQITQRTQGQVPAPVPTPAPQQQAASGGLGEILGSILGGASSNTGGNNPLGSILGTVLGGSQGNVIGDILGGMLGGKR
ncbi:MAG: DUF937 domain-containing protein [Mycobacterium sp.]